MLIFVFYPITICNPQQGYCHYLAMGNAWPTLLLPRSINSSTLWPLFCSILSIDKNHAWKSAELVTSDIIYMAGTIHRLYYQTRAPSLRIDIWSMNVLQMVVMLKPVSKCKYPLMSIYFYVINLDNYSLNICLKNMQLSPCLFIGKGFTC